MKTIIALLLVFAHFFVNGQTIDWEVSIILPESQAIRDVCIRSDGSLLGVGRSSNPPTGEIFLVNRSGQMSWRQAYTYPNFTNVFPSFILPFSISNTYVVGGTAFDSLNNSVIFLNLIDSSGSFIQGFNYPFQDLVFTPNGIILKDNEIICVSTLFGPSTNILVLRTDFTQLKWVNIIQSHTNDSHGDIIDMLDGSFIINGIKNQNNNYLWKFDFQGNLISENYAPDSIYKNGADTYLHIDTSLTEFYYSAFVDTSLNSSTYDGVRMKYNNSLNLVSENFIGRVVDNIEINTSFKFISETFDQSLNVSGVKYYNDANVYWQSNFPQFGPSLEIFGFRFNSFNELYAFGNVGSLTNRDYWFAKISGLGQEWIPNPCKKSKPVSGFIVDLNYPTLTLIDTSVSGMTYYDSSYTNTWTVNGIPYFNEDTLTIQIDTTINPNIDVELVIQNFYGCKDTSTYSNQNTSLSELSIIGLNVFPNPSKGQLTIGNRNTIEEELQFNLVSLEGKKVFTKFIQKGESQFDLPKKLKGMYFYEISSLSQIKKGKLILME